MQHCGGDQPPTSTKPFKQTVYLLMRYHKLAKYSLYAASPLFVLLSCVAIYAGFSWQAFIFLIYGVVAAVTGGFGAYYLYRGNKANFVNYMWAIGVHLFLGTTAFSYSIGQWSSSWGRWSEITVDQWNNLNDTQREMVQLGKHCCGFHKGDGTAYTGPATFNSTVNICADPTLLKASPGCFEVVADFVAYNENIAITMLCLLMLTSVVALAGAYYTNQRSLTAVTDECVQLTDTEDFTPSSSRNSHSQYETAKGVKIVSLG
jgi:hypothetical protein